MRRRASGAGARIDGETLERMARIARGLPGRTVAAEGEDEARISVDGIDADEVIASMRDVELAS